MKKSKVTDYAALNVLYQNCTNGSAPLNEGVTRAPDEE